MREGPGAGEPLRAAGLAGDAARARAPAAGSGRRRGGSAGACGQAGGLAGRPSRAPRRERAAGWSLGAEAPAPPPAPRPGSRTPGRPRPARRAQREPPEPPSAALAPHPAARRSAVRWPAGSGRRALCFRDKDPRLSERITLWAVATCCCPQLLLRSGFRHLSVSVGHCKDFCFVQTCLS